jgi:hypothetical protein
VVLTESDGGVSMAAQGARGENATEALADMFTTTPGMGNALGEADLIGIVVRSGIDVMWMARPPIEVVRNEAKSEWEVSVEASGAEVTMVSADEARDLYARLRAEYGGK